MTADTRGVETNLFLKKEKKRKEVKVVIFLDKIRSRENDPPESVSTWGFDSTQLPHIQLNLGIGLLLVWTCRLSACKIAGMSSILSPAVGVDGIGSFCKLQTAVV